MEGELAPVWEEVGSLTVEDLEPADQDDLELADQVVSETVPARALERWDPWAAGRAAGIELPFQIFSALHLGSYN